MRLTSDQLTDHQRQFGVEIFRGIDVDYSGMIDEEVSLAYPHDRVLVSHCDTSPRRNWVQ